MSKYFDWRIDSDKKVNDLLWLREHEDGTIKVVREYDGIWKLPEEELYKIDRVDPNVIGNSQDDVTDTCLGEAAIKDWKANGSPCIDGTFEQWDNPRRARIEFLLAMSAVRGEGEGL